MTESEYRRRPDEGRDSDRAGDEHGEADRHPHEHQGDHDDDRDEAGRRSGHVVVPPPACIIAPTSRMSR
jgi:hypothetical protein